MTVPLRDRLIQIIVKAILDGGPFGDHASNIADALLASEEWQARETELVRLRALLPDRHWIEMILAQPAGYWMGDPHLREWAQGVLAEHTRLDAGKEEGG